MPNAAAKPPLANERALMDLKRSILRKIDARLNLLQPLDRTRSA